MAVASHESIVKALGLWSAAQLGKTPEQWNGFVAKYGIEDPFDPWPPEEEAIQRFIKKFQERILTNVEAPITIAGNIDAKKLEELVGEFDREYEKVKNPSTEMKERAKKHVQEIIRNTIERPDVAPEHKELVFKVLKSEVEQYAEQHPDKEIPVQALVPKAIKTCESAQLFFQDQSTVASIVTQQAAFSKLKGKSVVQQAAAPFADAALSVFPGLRQGVVNKNLEDSLKNLLKTPEKISKLFDTFGVQAVDSVTFKQMIHYIQTHLDQSGVPKSAGSAVGNAASGLTSWIFRKPFDQTTTEGIRVFWEVWRADPVRAQMMILHPNKFSGAGMGLGSELFRLGTDYMFSRAKGAAVKAGLAKLGIEAVIPGAGWAVAAFELAKGLFGKATNWLKSLGGIKPGEVPGDRWILGVGCGAILLVLFILPVVTQLNFDSALVGRLALGGGQGTGPVVNCTQTPNDPLCTFTPCEGNCLWPASGYITQGPFTGGYCSNAAETSHDTGNAANGIDIATFDGGPVYTPRAGTVADVYTGCTDNSGYSGDHCGGSSSYAGYGNYVILKTDDGYTLIFAHLLSAIGVTSGQHVEAGAQLGWMDQTGSSTGTHLHFGVLSGGSVLDFVPKNDSAHTPESINGCMKGGVSCTKACPTTPVTAGTP